MHDALIELDPNPLTSPVDCIRPRSLLAVSLWMVAITFCIAASGTVFSQGDPVEKPKLKDFGSSLKRLKWDQKQRKAVEKSNKTRPAQTDGDVIKIETKLVVTDALVLDSKGVAVSGLKAEDFIVTEDGQPQEVRFFSLGADAKVPRTIVLILDASKSLWPVLDTSAEAAKKFVDRINPGDRVAIVNDRVKLVCSFTRDKTALKNCIENIRKNRTVGFETGASRQFSALMASFRELFDDEDIRPIVILQADGDERPFLRRIHEPKTDFTTSFGWGDLMAAAERSRATIFTVYPSIRLLELPPEEQRRIAMDYYKNYDMSGLIKFALMQRSLNRNPFEKDEAEIKEYFFIRFLEERLRQQEALEDLSSTTGGWTEYLNTADEADEVYTRILAGIENRYVIGYYPRNEARDGKRRRIKVEVRGHPEYTIVGKRAYIAPGPQD